MNVRIRDTTRLPEFRGEGCGTRSRADFQSMPAAGHQHRHFCRPQFSTYADLHRHQRDLAARLSGSPGLVVRWNSMSISCVSAACATFFQTSARRPISNTPSASSLRGGSTCVPRLRMSYRGLSRWPRPLRSPRTKANTRRLTRPR